MRVSWIGLGKMGLPMALNLHRGGFDVRSFDRSHESRSQAAAHGMAVEDSFVEAVRDSDFVFVMLPTGRHVRHVLAESNLHEIAPNAVCVNSSTISPADARLIAEDIGRVGLQFVDAPVSGGTVVAEDGHLTFMVGASAEQLALVQPLLETMGSNVFHLGGTGCGQAAKVVNNMLLAMNMASLSEAAVLAGRLGIDHATFREVTQVSSGDSWVLRHYFPLPDVVPTAPSSHGYEPGFTAALMRKDVGLALEEAAIHGVGTSMTSQAADLLDQIIAHGLADLDFSAIVRVAAGEI